jgi:tetratricopeptide (TPR) repeat protein
MPQRVSFCLIVKNEEQRLAQCLRSAVDLASETIVVDTGSTDRTKDIARSLGARVVDFPWRDSFSAAMNESIRHAQGEWIFWLHADHWVDETNRERLRRLFAGLTDENAAYLMKWRCPSRQPGESGVDIDSTHLFRNHPQIRWRYRVHEQIRDSIEKLGGTTRFTDVVIFHSGYQDPIEHTEKLKRNLRLLRLDDQENPNDASVLFHLGWTLYLLGRPAEAIGPLERSVKLLTPQHTILRKALALVIRCGRQLQQPQTALKACRVALKYYPSDPELLFHEGQLLRELGDLAGAEQSLLKLIALPAERIIACGVDLGLRGYKSRCALAEVYRDQGRLTDAEAQFRVALAEKPDFTVARLLLCDMWLRAGLPERVEQFADELQSQDSTRVDGLLLRARSRMLSSDYPAARRLCSDAIQLAPGAPWPLELFSHTLLLEGNDVPALVRALQRLLELDPTNDFALRNLPAALQKQRALEPAAAGPADDPFAPIIVGGW